MEDNLLIRDLLAALKGTAGILANYEDRLNSNERRQLARARAVIERATEWEPQ